MSNQETMTIGQKKAALQADALVAEAERARALLAFERTTLDTLLQRIENGEFETEDAAREAAKLCLKEASQSTLDAFEAGVVDSWSICEANKCGREAAAKKDEEWAVARLDFWNRLGSQFTRSWSFDSGQLPAEALELAQKASCWHRDGYIGKVSGYVDVTPEGNTTYKLVVSNPRRVEGQMDVHKPKAVKKG